MNKLGAFINRYRLENNLSLREFAAMCDLSHTHIDSIEKGVDFRTKKPVRVTNETFLKLAKATKKDPAYLLNLSLGKEETGVRMTDQIKLLARKAEKLPEKDKKKARQITRDTVEEFLDLLANKGFAANYIKDIKNILSSILEYGVDLKMYANNPCSKARVTKKVRRTKKKESFNLVEQEIIAKYRDKIPFGREIAILLHTGLRAQEICAISNKSLLYLNNFRFLYINEAMKRTSNGAWKIGAPKSESSIRYVPIIKEDYDYIAQKILSHASGFFLPKYDGKPISYTKFLSQYKNFFRVLNELEPGKVRYLSPHSCRHTFASELQRKGISDCVRKELMGHSEIEMTNEYTHVSIEEKISAIKMIA